MLRFGQIDVVFGPGEVVPGCVRRRGGRLVTGLAVMNDFACRGVDLGKVVRGCRKHHCTQISNLTNRVLLAPVTLKSTMISL